MINVGINKNVTNTQKLITCTCINLSIKKWVRSA